MTQQLLNFVLWNQAAGAAERSVGVTDGNMLEAPGAGRIWVQISADPADVQLTLVNGVPTEVPRLSAAELLKVAQDARWAEAKAVSALRKASGCRTPKGVVQTDAESRSDIRMLAADALSNQTDNRLRTLVSTVTIPASTWSKSFRMLDNSEVTHSADEMIALAKAVTDHIDKCKAARVAIRAKIYAATTIAAVQAVNINTGYPANS